MYNKAKNHIDQSTIVISCYRRTTSKRSILYQGCKLWNSEISKNLQKQPRRGVPRKMCSKNKQKIYRRTLMPKCDFNDVLCNFIEITLRHGCSPVNLLHILRIPFLMNTSWCLLLNLKKFDNIQQHLKSIKSLKSLMSKKNSNKYLICFLTYKSQIVLPPIYVLTVSESRVLMSSYIYKLKTKLCKK